MRIQAKRSSHTWWKSPSLSTTHLSQRRFSASWEPPLNDFSPWPAIYSRNDNRGIPRREQEKRCRIKWEVSWSGLTVFCSLKNDDNTVCVNHTSFCRCKFLFSHTAQYWIFSTYADSMYADSLTFHTLLSLNTYHPTVHFLTPQPIPWDGMAVWFQFLNNIFSVGLYKELHIILIAIAGLWYSATL